MAAVAQAAAPRPATDPDLKPPPVVTQIAPATAQSGPFLSLEEVVQTALTQNPQLGAAMGTAAASAARVGQSRSGWLPQLNLNGQVRGDYSYQTGVESNNALQTLRYSGQLTLSQMLYDFGRTTGRIEGAKANAYAASADADTQRTQVALQATTAFYNVLMTDALVEVAQKNLEQQQQRLRQAESFVKIGTRPEIDALIARTAVANAELQRVQARSNLYSARTQLLLAVGVPAASWSQWLGRPLNPVASQPMPREDSAPEQAVDLLLDEALKARPEHRALQARVDAAAAQLRTVRGDFLPTLSLTGIAGINGSYGGNTVAAIGGTSRLDVPVRGEPGFSLSGFLTLSWPLISGGQTVFAVREAEALLIVAQRNLEALRLQVRGQLLLALFQVATARESYAASQKLLQQAELQLAMASGRYQAGVGNPIEVGDAQVAATTARAQRVGAEYTLAAARANLAWQLGRLIDTRSGS